MQDFYIKQRTKLNLQIILLIVFILTCIGILFIYSSSCIFAHEKHGSSFYFVKKQGGGFALALLLFFVCAKFPLKILKKFAFLLFVVSLGITALTLVPGFGRMIHGSSRWLVLYGIAFQPSELLKISLFLYVAKILEKRRFKPFDFLGSYLPLISIVVIAMILLLLQPDFGLAVTLFVTFFTLLFIVRLRLRYVIITLASCIPVLLFLVILKPYRIKRLFTYLNPWRDPQGSGFQIIQSLIAIGSGGFSGVGLSKSKQKFFYLPMQHTDFIFSIIAEEVGFIGSACIIFLFVFFLYTGIKVALFLKNYYGMLLVLSFVLLINFQAIINLGVSCGLLPTKGIGLPFVSYGITCLIGSFAMMGLIANAVLNDSE